MVPVRMRLAAGSRPAGVAAGLGAVLPGLALSPAVLAMDLFIYPASGQSPEQQRRDELDCRLWAIDQTGFDPTLPVQDAPSHTPPPQVQRQGPDMTRSTVRGAAAGTNQGALRGVGRQADQRRSQQEATQDWARQQQIQQAERQQLQQYRRQSFNRAVTACMEGRGYSVT